LLLAKRRRKKKDTKQAIMGWRAALGECGRECWQYFGSEGRGKCPSDPETQKKRCRGTMFCVWIVAIILASTSVSEDSRLVAFETAACDEHGWDKGQCNVTDVNVSAFRERGSSDSFTVEHRVLLSTSLTDEDEVVATLAWKSPAYANDRLGAQKEYNIRSDADHYANLFRVGESYGCYYNPKTAQELNDNAECAFQCRDKPMQKAWIVAIVFLCILLSPFAALGILLLGFCCSFALDCVLEACDDSRLARRGRRFVRRLFRGRPNRPRRTAPSDAGDAAGTAGTQASSNPMAQPELTSEAPIFDVEMVEVLDTDGVEVLQAIVVNNLE
jgi:hypothetical protein